MIPALVHEILLGHPIDPRRIEGAIHALMRGGHDDVETAALLTALAARPLQPQVLAAAARALREHGTTIRPQVRPLVDTCGTGGDGAGTFNISTATALVLAGAGLAVAKHGNRAVTSRVGSADVLEAAGCSVQLPPAACRRLLDATGFAFLFAPVFHPAMRHVASVRRRLRIRTLFNVLGPLANPAGAEFQLLGVYAPELTEVVACALADLGSRGALVVHCDGLDEIGLHAPTLGHRVRDGRVEPFRLDPTEHGVARVGVDRLAGGDLSTNFAILRDSLSGGAGSCADAVAVNVAAALEISGRVATFGEGLELARSLLAAGAGQRVLERYAEASRREQQALAPEEANA